MFYINLVDEKELKVPLDKESWLVRFLRPCKFYPESACELVCGHYDVFSLVLYF